MKVRRLKCIRTMLKNIRISVYNSLKYEIDTYKGLPKVDPKTKKRITKGLPDKYCKRVARERVDKIKDAIKHLPFTYKDGIVHTTKNGDVIYYLYVNHPARAFILYLLEGKRSIRIVVFAVYSEGKDINAVLKKL